MKNFLKISPEVWKKERAIGQTSFIIKRTIAFSIVLLPLFLVINYLMLSEKEVFRVSQSVIPAIFTSLLMSINQWAELEYNYRKNTSKENQARAEV